MTFTEPIPVSGMDKLPTNAVLDAMMANQNMQATHLQGSITERRIMELENKLEAVMKILYHNRELCSWDSRSLSTITGLVRLRV